MSDEQAFHQFISHRYFQPHITPIQLFNSATDPMLPDVAISSAVAIAFELAKLIEH